MMLNPIVKREIRVQARSMRICWTVFAYEAIMAAVYFVAMTVLKTNSMYGTENIYSSLIWLYPVLSVTQILILGVIVPIRTASAISGEKERQTFDIMMTTSMSCFSVIMGKVMTAIIQDMFFVAASLPIMALVFVIGGLPWSYLLWFFLLALLVSLFSASIGIFCSSVSSRTITAVIMAYGLYLIFFAAPFLPLFLVSYYEALGNAVNYDNLAWALLPLLINPGVYLYEFFSHVMTGKSAVYEIVSFSPQNHGFLNAITSGYWWLIISSILLVACSFFFLWLASRLINPVGKRYLRAKKRRMPRKKAAESDT
ncbi:MAG: ABC transporter permease [Agathobacter sp.]|nr:ABC transporter permease [Agathobacter sp.]